MPAVGIEVITAARGDYRRQGRGCVLKRDGYGSEIVIVLILPVALPYLLARPVICVGCGIGYLELRLCLVVIRLYAEIGKSLEERRGDMRVAVKQHPVKIPDIIFDHAFLIAARSR